MGKRLREYKVAVYVVEGDDVEVLREVFDRVNSSGKPLNRDEVFDALVGSKVVDGDDAGLGLVTARLRDLDFGGLERDTIHNTLEAVRGDRIGKADPRAMTVDVVAEGLERSTAALRATMHFLRSVASVPHLAVMPYELPLVVLARFFSLFPAPTERSLSLLRRWLWRGSLNGALSGASGTLQRHVDDDLPGALRVQAEPGETATPPSDPVPVPLAEKRGPGIRFSLAGVQLKASVVADGGRVTLPLVGEQAGWIAKFPSGRHEALPENEPSMLRWAQRVGLDVPPHRLVAVRSIENLPQGLEPELKYVDEGLPDGVHYGAIAAIVRRHCGDATWTRSSTGWSSTSCAATTMPIARTGRSLIPMAGVRGSRLGPPRGRGRGPRAGRSRGAQPPGSRAALNAAAGGGLHGTSLTSRALDGAHGRGAREHLLVERHERRRR